MYLLFASCFEMVERGKNGGGGKKIREVELGEGLRKGNGGDTGRNDEHRGKT